jgi:hypothetical protein
MLLIDIILLHEQVFKNQRLGGFNSLKYPSTLINKVLDISQYIPILEVLVEEDLENTINTITNPALKSILESIEEQLTLLPKVHLEEQLSENLKDIYIPVKNNELDLSQLSLIVKKQIMSGQFFTIYDKNDEVVGKAVLRLLYSRRGTLKFFFLNNESIPIKAKLDKWWRYSSNINTWISNLAFTESVDNLSTIKAEINKTRIKLGYLNWSLLYNNDHLIAKGVDSYIPGVIFISKENVLLKSGKYKLLIVDKIIRSSYGKRIIVEWEVLTPTNKLTATEINIKYVN